MTTYRTVAEWAKATGSQAKTRAGQRKAIIASFRFGSGLRGTNVTLNRWEQMQRSSAAQFLARRTRQRQERFAASHPVTLAWPAPATQEGVQGRGNAPVPLSSLKDGYGFARLGGWTIRLTEDVDYVKGYYSKGYDSRYGGKKEISNRRVCIRRVAPAGTEFPGSLEARDVAVESWRGNFLLDALIRSGIVEAHKGQKDIRLHPAYDVKLIRDSRIKIYERTLCDEHIDFCAVAHQVTYHAPSVKEAVAGLRLKLRKASLKAKGQAITLALGRSLGFCDEGMKAFCAAFDLDLRGTYTPDEIASRVRGNMAAAEPFEAELRTLASAVGYKF